MVLIPCILTTCDRVGISESAFHFILRPNKTKLSFLLPGRFSRVLKNRPLAGTTNQSSVSSLREREREREFILDTKFNNLRLNLENTNSTIFDIIFSHHHRSCYQWHAWLWSLTRGAPTSRIMITWIKKTRMMEWRYIIDLKTLKSKKAMRNPWTICVRSKRPMLRLPWN